MENLATILANKNMMYELEVQFSIKFLIPGNYNKSPGILRIPDGYEDTRLSQRYPHIQIIRRRLLYSLSHQNL